MTSDPLADDQCHHVAAEIGLRCIMGAALLIDLNHVF